MTDREYLDKNIILEKGYYEGSWQARFVFADGFSASRIGKGNAKTIKPQLKAKLIETIIEKWSKIHPIQPSK